MIINKKKMIKVGHILEFEIEKLFLKVEGPQLQ